MEKIKIIKHSKLLYDRDKKLYYRVINHTSSPRWNKTYEFEIQDYGVNHNLLTFSVFDSDPLGADELIATQVIPITYFDNKQKFGKEEDLWIELSSISSYEKEDKILFVTNENIFMELGNTNFGDNIITNNKQKLGNQSKTSIYYML